MTFVVDTNVVVVANDREAHIATPQCVLACVERLKAILSRERVVVDAGYEILSEYLRYANLSGKGVGDVFVKWVFHNHWNVAHCDAVEISPSEDGGYLEFPAHPRLSSFDLSDRKFVAVSIAHPERPPILNAVDSDWDNFTDALAAHGVTVTGLCPEDRPSPG